MSGDDAVPVEPSAIPPATPAPGTGSPSAVAPGTTPTAPGTTAPEAASTSTQLQPFTSPDAPGRQEPAPAPLERAEHTPARLAPGSLDRFAHLVTAALDVPAALVSFLTDTEQLMPGAVGLPEPWQSRRAVPLSYSLCRYVVAHGSSLAVPDVRLDPTVTSADAVEHLGIVAWAGAPIRALRGGSTTRGPEASGPIIGVVCAIDRSPRTWTAADLSVLEDVAASCAIQLRMQELQVEADATQRHTTLLLGLSEALSDIRSVSDVEKALARLATGELEAVHCVLRVGSGHDVHDPRSRTGPERGPGADPAPDRESVAGPTRAPAPALGATMRLPLVVGGDTLGVLELGWDAARETTAAERAVAGALARYGAQALRRALDAAQRRTSAEVLQRSLLTRLPEPDHLEIRARYVPAARGEHVGGDWYDAVLGADGATTVVIGDVAGHDITAAAQMGQVRGLLRAYAWDRAEPPSALVTRLDSAVVGLRVDVLATLVVARVEEAGYLAVPPAPSHPSELARPTPPSQASTRLLRWTNAGHPPPLLLHPDASTEVLASTPEILLGLLPSEVRHDHVVALPDGATLLLYTDGLIEHRGRSLDAGLADLRAALVRHAGQPLESLLDALVTELVGDDPDDDCALLAVRTHPEDRPRPAEAGPNRR